MQTPWAVRRLNVIHQPTVPGHDMLSLPKIVDLDPRLQRVGLHVRDRKLSVALFRPCRLVAGLFSPRTVREVWTP